MWPWGLGKEQEGHSSETARMRKGSLKLFPGNIWRADPALKGGGLISGLREVWVCWV